MLDCAMPSLEVWAALSLPWCNCMSVGEACVVDIALIAILWCSKDSKAIRDAIMAYAVAALCRLRPCRADSIAVTACNLPRSEHLRPLEKPEWLN
eukprot:6459663-Amphidinium_carterae.1